VPTKKTNISRNVKETDKMNRKTMMTSAAAGILSLSLLAGAALPAMAQDTETSPAHPVEPGVPGGRGGNGPMGGRGMHDGAMGGRGGMTGRDGMMGRGGMLGLSATVVSADDESIVVTLAVPDVAADDSAQADQPGGRPGNFGRGGRGGGRWGWSTRMASLSWQSPTNRLSLTKNSTPSARRAWMKATAS
jgi:hypothetical protein